MPGIAHGHSIPGSRRTVARRSPQKRGGFARGAALSLANPAPSGNAPQEAEDRAQEDAQNRTEQTRILGAQVAQAMRQGEHPLSYRHIRDYPIDQMGRGIVHPAAPTRGAEASAAARERYPHGLPEGRTGYARRAPRQDAAVEGTVQLSPAKQPFCWG